jgi:SAM-dependent methyltransferase
MTSLESVDATNREVWSRILDQAELLYPDEQVVRFLARRGRVRDGAGLDVGFGSGRHLKVLMDHGYQASGIEVIQDALDIAAKRFGDHPLMGELRLADMRGDAFPPGSFDVAVAWGVTFVRPKDEILTDLEGLARMLKPGGGLCVNFRTTDNWLYGLGEQVGESSWVLDDRAGVYSGAYYTFLTADEATGLLEKAGFQVDDMERFELWRDRATKRHSWWNFTATRR